MQCRTALSDADQALQDHYDKIDLPVVRPVVTRVERCAGHCPCCGGVTLAPVPAGMEAGSPFSLNILALAIHLRFTHATRYQRVSRLFLHLFALQISEGALDAMFRRAKPCLDNEVAAILARLRRSWIICSDETSVRIDGHLPKGHWWIPLQLGRRYVRRRLLGHGHRGTPRHRCISGDSRCPRWGNRNSTGLSSYGAAVLVNVPRA
jgi:transposase